MKGQFVRPGSKKRFFAGASVHKEPKKWGEEHWIVNKEYCGKKLILKKNRRCSMHSHKEKDEVFYVQSGKVLLELDGEQYTLKSGDFIHVPANVPHRFTGLEDSEIFEFSTTHHEEDSYRSSFSGHIEQDKYDRQCALIHHFAAVKVLVVGDAMLDTYITGSVSRISPEAPIPVVQKDKQWDTPGGAANVAHNIKSLCGHPTLVAVRGSDAPGRELDHLLKKSKVNTQFVVDKGRCTTQKQRIIGNGGQQITRLDFEESHDISITIQKKLLEKVQKALEVADVVILSDYAKGVLTPTFLQQVITLAKKAKVPVVLDPKPKSREYLKHARGVTVFTPNRKEALLLTDQTDDMKKIASSLSASLKGNVLLTLGGDGMLLASGKKKHQSFPALAREVTDISGAGDTVVATLALALGAGGSLEDAVDLSNRAASVVVGKLGTATLTCDELLSTL